MQQIKEIIQEMIPIKATELNGFIKQCSLKTYKKKSHLLDYQDIPQHTFFINKGLVRFCVLNPKGELHTTHFSMENEFTGDYASFLTGKPSIYTIEALEDIEVVLIPKTAIFWGYEHMRFGDRLGRLIAEHYFVFMDNRIREAYLSTVKERYDNITQNFPNIHQRVPQHMIASFLGITSVHLSRLKKGR